MNTNVNEHLVSYALGTLDDEGKRDVEAEHDRLETQHDHVVGLFGNVHFRFLGNDIVWFLGNVVGLAIVRLVLARDDRYQPAVMTAAIVTQSGENETP